MNLQDDQFTRNAWWTLPLCLLLIFGTFIIDVWVPLGVAGGIPYVAPVLLAAFLPKRWTIFAVSTICSFLTIVGFYYSPALDLANWKILANRGLALFAIWAIAILGFYQNTFRDQREQAFRRIQVLEGILPICMTCKKIRNHKGNWENLETYITQHSEARFSHGYCPECGAEVLESVKRTMQSSP